MMSSGCSAAHSKLQGLLKELVGSHDNRQLAELADSALQLLPGLPTLDRGKREQRALADQLHSSAIAVWNRSVALKSAGAINLSLNAQIRHVACSLVLLCNALQPSATVFLKQMTMATKTGRAWLDCDNSSMADTSLLLATECWEKMKAQFPSAAKEESVTKILFKLLCFRAEAAVGQEQHEPAIQLLQQAREMLHILESEAGYLAMLCYNLGLDLFQKTAYQHSVAWLKESYEIGRGCSSVGAVKQARTLRLMANAYLEWDEGGYWQKALNAVGLANSEHCHPAGLLLKTNILLHHEQEGSLERLQVTFLETLRHEEVTMDMALATVRRCAEAGRYVTLSTGEGLGNTASRTNLAFSGVQELLSRYRGTPLLPQAQLLHLELLLSNQRVGAAKKLVEDIITADNTGDPVDVKSRKQLHLLFWSRAAASYETSDFEEALEWYNYSLSLFPSTASTDKNMGKLQRNRCSCLLSLGQLEKASEVITEATQCDPNSPYGHFLGFKLSVLQAQEDNALQALKALVECTEDRDTVSGLVCLAAQMAFEKTQRVVATAALEQVLQHTSQPQQAFTALRCLIRLKLTFLNEVPDKLGPLHSLISYIQVAEKRLSERGQGNRNRDEAGWFMKVSWNLALQCGENYKEMGDLFTACYEISHHLVTDQAVLVRRKTCQLMAAAARLHQARDTSAITEKVPILEQVLVHVSECRSISQQIGTRANDPSDPTMSILCLYEYEARHSLGQPDSDTVLDQLASQPSPDPKMFETIAALAMQGPQKGRVSAARALKWSIHYHLQQAATDWTRLSKCYHSHIQLVMEGEKGGDRAAMDEAWSILEEVLEVLDTRAEGHYPEMEVLWLLTKAWNCGIHLYSVHRYKEAELWCSMGMKFLKFLSQLKPSYEEQMATVYSEVLARLQGASSLTTDSG